MKVYLVILKGCFTNIWKNFWWYLAMQFNFFMSKFLSPPQYNGEWNFVCAAHATKIVFEKLNSEISFHKQCVSVYWVIHIRLCKHFTSGLFSIG